MKSILLIIICLVLAACSDAPMPYDPALQANDARATIEAATAIAQSTAQEERRQSAETTREAARTRQASQDEIAAIEAQIRGTQAALDVSSTIAAGTQIAESVRVTEIAAGMQTATAWPPTAIAMRATEISIIARQQYEDARANLQLMGVFAVVALAMFLFAWVIVTLTNALTRRYWAANTIYGPVGFSDDVRLLAAAPQPAPAHFRPREIPEVVSLTRSGSVLSSPVDKDRLRNRLIDLIKAAIIVAGEDAQQLPRWDKLPGMNSERMQRYVDTLEQAGAVEVLPSKGTFLVGGRDLKTLLYELQTEGLKLYPLSPND